MTLSPPRCAVNMEQRLAALRRDQEIDGLRVYLIKYELFPRNRDPHNSPIRVEELKELVKHWKLHRQRDFWRDHPDKEDLVRALLQHIKSEAANKKRRQDAQDKYRAKSAAAAGVDAAKMRDFANILGHADADRAEGGEGAREQAVAAAKRRNFGGGDLFYQRGDYDEGMIYLSRIDKARFRSEQHDPRADLLAAAASAPTPLDRLMMLGDTSATAPASSKPGDKDGQPAAASTPLLRHAVEMAVAAHPASASATLLTREARLRSVEGLYNISCHRGFEAQLVREGALATISAVVKADDAAIRLLAAATLFNLTAPPPTRGQKQQTPPLESDALAAALPIASYHQHQQQPQPQQQHSVTHLPLATREIYAKMVDGGAVAVLLELSHTPHATVKALCARALLRLSLDDAHHFAMVHEGAVAALAQLMAAASGADDAVRETCMLALVNLAGVPRAVACDAVLTALTALAKAGDARTQRRCAQALLNLSILPTTRSSLVEDGAVGALALLAATRQVPVLDVVACVLCNLAGVRTNQEPLVKNGALPIVLDVLDAVERAHAQIAESAAGEEDEEGEEGADKAAAASPSSLPARTAPTGDDADAEAAARLALARIRKNCVTVVAYLCCNAKLRARVGGAGVVGKMLRVLQAVRVPDGQSTSAAARALDGDTEKAVVLAIANLSLEDRCRPGIVQDGAVSLLLRVLRAGNDADAADVLLLQLDGVTALSNLMLHPLNFARLVDEGVVPAFIAQLRGGHSAEMRRACAYALLTLARDPGMKTRLAQVAAAGDADRRGGAIPAMLALASAQLQDAELCGVCVSFLRHLSSRAENHEALFFEGAPALLVRVLLLRRRPPPKAQHGEPPAPATKAALYSLWMDCMAALANLARCSARQGDLLADGVMEAIQHVLAAAGGARAERGGLGLAVDRAVAKTQLAAAAILDELHAHCCGRPEGASTAAFVASLLLLATQASARHSQLDKRAALVQQRAAQRVALTIARVALLVPRGLQLLAAHADLPPALNTVLRTGLHEAQACAAIALCNLATARGALPRRVWRDPATADFLVIALLRLNRAQTKVVCAKALFNLLSHADTRAQLVADGALYALLQLAKLDSDEIRDLALRAVYNLSLDASRARQLLDMELVRALAAMYQPELARAFKKLLCGILSNLSSGGAAASSAAAAESLGRAAQEGDADAERDAEADAEATGRHALQMLHEGALGVLRSLAKARDPETKVYALNALFNLSCARAACDPLLRDEANVLALLLAELRADGSREGARYAAMALANLSGSALAVAQLTDGGGPATKSVASSTATATTTAAAPAASVLNDAMKRALARLSGDEDARALAAPTLSACVLALRNLLTRAANRRAFVACGGVQTLAALLASAELVARESATLQEAADLLCALARRQDEPDAGEERAEERAASCRRGQERLVKDGVVRALAAIARASADSGASATAAREARTRMDVAAALCALSANAACHELMLRDGALDALANLSRTNPGDPRAPFKGLVAVRGEDFGALVAVALRNLSRLDPALAAASGHESSATADSAAAADEVKGQRLAAQPATVQVALALALATQADTRLHVSVALLSLSRFRKCRQQMVKHDAARALLRLGSPAASALQCHVCALALQALATHATGGGGEAQDDPHVRRVLQEGIVAAIAALAEQHQPEVLAAAGAAIVSVVDAPVGALAVGAGGNEGEQLALERADYRVMAHKGAPPDWERVLITDLSAWPELAALADDSARRSARGADPAAADEADVVVEEEEEDSSDEDGDVDVDAASIAAAGDGRQPGSPSGKQPARARSPVARGANRATASTAPRTCSMDVVLGSLQLLSDEGGDKVCVDVDSELALRRTANAAASASATSSSSSSSSSGVQAGAGVDGSDALPKLRLATAPDPTEDPEGLLAPASAFPSVQSPHARGGRQSTLKQARQDASWASSSLTVSPARSPGGSSSTAAAGTPKRRSRATLEPLAVSPPSPASAHSSAHWS